MQLLLRLNVRDILYVVTNAGGGYDKVKIKGKKLQCVKIQSTFTTPSMSNYLSSNEFYNNNMGDFLLYEAANKSLDNTIHNVIGIETFTTAYNEFLDLKLLIKDTCGKLDLSPCSQNGTLQLDVSSKNCYIDDFGCGYKCLNDLYSKYNQEKS